MEAAQLHHRLRCLLLNMKKLKILLRICTFNLKFNKKESERRLILSKLLIKTKTNSLTNEWNSYPVLKLFKGNFMVELGYDENDEWDAHLMYRF